MEMYFDRDGEPIGLYYWASLVGTDYQRVRYDKFGEVEVSTVWLGLNHNFLGGRLPVIFETMVFGGPLDEEQWRYGTEEQAIAGHADVVALVRAEQEFEK